MKFWSKYRSVILLAVAFIIVGVLLSACGNDTAPVSSGTIVDIVKHDDVERKERVCVRERKDRYRQNGQTRTRTVCSQYRVIEREISPEYYEFKLRDGNKTGWLHVDEATGESYRRGDYYP